MEQENNKKKMILPMILGITVLTILVLGATYAYFTVGASNNFGTKTITATTPEIGSVSLSSGDSLSLNMTSELMMEENVGTYYATTTGVPSTTLTEVDIATASVTGTGNFNCAYDLTITPSATNSLYTAFTGMTGHDSNQIVLKVGSHTYDFNTTDFSSPITINESFNNITSSASGSIKASLMFNNTNFDQNALQGKDITLTFSASNLSCTAVEAPTFIAPAIGNFVTLDNQAGTYYRVLYNDSETNYMLLRMNNDLGTVKYNTASTTVTFENGSPYLKYSGSTLDTYMNETFYNTLSANIKNAIVDKNVDQKAYEFKTDYMNKPYTEIPYTYAFEYNFSGENMYMAANYMSKTNVGTRHVYAPDIEDIYKYMSAKKGSSERVITSTELMNMFFNTNGNTTISQDIWLRSANSGSLTEAWSIYGFEGRLQSGNRGSNVFEGQFRPAFVINLDAVDFTEVDSSTITPATLGN